jgi:hypothetical protein
VWYGTRGRKLRLLFTRNMTGFCRVCQRGISRVIDLYAE